MHRGESEDQADTASGTFFAPGEVHGFWAFALDFRALLAAILPYNSIPKNILPVVEQPLFRMLSREMWREYDHE